MRITLNELVRQDSIVPYWGNEGVRYKLISAKCGGSSLGAVYTSKVPVCWLNEDSYELEMKLLGKIGYTERSEKGTPVERLADFTRIRRRSAIISVLEKLAADHYGLLSHKNGYEVCRVWLAELPIENQYTKDNALTECLVEEINRGRPGERVIDGVFVISEYLPSYQDFATLNCSFLLDGEQAPGDSYLLKADAKYMLRGGKLHYCCKSNREEICLDVTPDQIKGICEKINLERNGKSLTRSDLDFIFEVTGHKAEFSCCVLSLDEEEERLGFDECIARRMVPQFVDINKKVVPVVGLMELLSAAVLLADTDVLGASGTNAGFIVERDKNGVPLSVQTVKIDPGESFGFDSSYNLLLDLPGHPKGDRRNIQYASQYANLPILWDGLTPFQRKSFLTALQQGLKHIRLQPLQEVLENPELLRTPSGREIPSVKPYLDSWPEYLDRVERLYSKDLASLKTPSDDKPTLGGGASP